MRIALASPFGHPEVHRGVERYCRDLGGWLAARDNEVTWCFTEATGRRDVPEADGLRIRTETRGVAVGTGRFALDDTLRSASGTWRALRAAGAESVHAFHHVSAAAAGCTSLPVVFTLPGVPRPESLGGRPLHRLSFRFAVRTASRLTCLSEYARDSLRRHFDLEAEVLPPGVDVDRWSGPRTAGAPRILCTAAAGDPRKNVDLLLRAVPLIRREHGDVEVVLAPPDVDVARHLVTTHLGSADRDCVQIVDCADADELGAWYRSASVAVLPSVDEAFGLVLVEALASGTPIVGTDHGAIPEVIDDAGIGQLFTAGDPVALSRAIGQVLELSTDAGTAERCRRHARRWDWSVVGPAHEELHAAFAG